MTHHTGAAFFWVSDPSLKATYAAGPQKWEASEYKCGLVDCAIQLQKVSSRSCHRNLRILLA